MASDRRFIAPRLRPSNVDLFVIRSSIYQFVLRERATLGPIVVDVGCGRKPYASLFADLAQPLTYVGVDIPSERYGAEDVGWDGTRLPLRDGSVDGVMLTEVLEHCPDPDTLLQEISRILRPGGRLVGTTPFMWPLHDVPDDYHRLTPFSLANLLELSAFEAISIEALTGWNGACAQMLGLWARRGTTRPRVARLRSLAVVLPVKLLLALDRPAAKPEESTMALGWAFSATAR